MQSFREFSPAEGSTVSPVTRGGRTPWTLKTGASDRNPCTVELLLHVDTYDAFLGN